MTDILDRAEEEIEADLAEALRQRKPVGPAPTGYCLTRGCGEPLAPSRRWCGPACEEAWEYEQNRRAANGR